ncbi:MAG: hypothetical protein D6722_24035 [Bacteroidetes bacterium]|nr:MAG: hypothetical protein D6722_24035 [Bacteroidota bacterium]
MSTPSSSKGTIWAFWGLFVCLNLLLFLPVYLFNADDVSFLPSHGIWGEGAPWWQGLLVRSNLDLFRLSAEWALLVTLGGLLVRWRRGPALWRWLATSLYLFLLIYQLYYAGSIRIYGQHPLILNDLVLAKEVLPIYLDQLSGGSWLIYPLALLGLGVVIALVVLLIRTLSRLMARMSGLSLWGGLALIWLLVLLGTLGSRGLDFRPDYFAVQWTSPLIQRSLVMEDLNKIEQLPGKLIYQGYDQMPLARKPDIYLLFIESYGRAIATKPWTRDAYYALIQNLEDSLRQAGWHSQSAYSEAPILGGKSWLSFTTVMTGVKIDNQLHFNDLLSLHPNYPHLMHYLKGQGYGVYRMKTFSKQKASTEEAYALQDNFFGFDRWVKHGDIPYQGFEYDFHGGIPDQYALGYFRDEVVGDTTKPTFLFFITMASHVPWFPPPPVVADWRQLDSITEDPYHIPIADTVTRRYDRFMARLEDKMAFRYAKAIRYDLQMAKEFILSHPREDALFIVLGDHQPPALTYYGGDGLEVPVHLISRDSALLSGFEAYGFQPGMTADTTLPAPLQHAGIYSMLMRELTTRYGTGRRARPVYLKEGI